MQLSAYILLLASFIIVLYSQPNAAMPSTRVKRSFLPFTMGHMILGIKCDAADVDTVCAPGGSQDCPRGYRAQENRGACGFATLAHFISSRNIAGTCCIRDVTIDQPSTTTARPTSTTAAGPSTTTKAGPKVIVYGVPVYAGYQNLPSYGDQSSYGSKGSPIYAIEAVNGYVGAQTNNVGGYVGSRSFPDFKVTEVQPEFKTGQASSALSSRQQRPAATQAADEQRVKIEVQQPQQVEIAINTDNVKKADDALEKRQLYPPASSQQPAPQGSVENGPLFYPYPALPQPNYGTGSKPYQTPSSSSSSSSLYATGSSKPVAYAPTTPVRSIDEDVKQIKSIDDIEAF